MTENLRDIRSKLLDDFITNESLITTAKFVLGTLRQDITDVRFTGFADDRGTGSAAGFQLVVKGDLGTRTLNVMRLLYLAAIGAQVVATDRVQVGVSAGNDNLREENEELARQIAELHELLSEAESALERASERCDTIRNEGPDVASTLEEMQMNAQAFVESFTELLSGEIQEVAEATEGLCGDVNDMRRIAQRIREL